MIVKSPIFFILTSLLLLSFLLAQVHAVTWIRIEPEILNVNPGGESIIKIYVGEEIKNQRVILDILDKPPWLNYSFSIIGGKTPFTSNLTIRLSENAPTGNYTLRIALKMGDALLEERKVTLNILPVFTPPEIYFTNYTCPSTVRVGGKIFLDLSFNYTLINSTMIRVRIFVDEQIETMIEFQLSGNGSTPLYRQITAPPEPGDTTIKSTIEYFDLVNKTWNEADLKLCKVEVVAIPTILKIGVVGLPASLKVSVQILIVPHGPIIERSISSDSEERVDLSIYQPSTILVIVEDEIFQSNSTKYVAENNLREIYAEPGWTVTLQFNYSPWYVVVEKVKPEDNILKILEGNEWVKRGENLLISAPRIIESSSKRFTLSHIELNGEILSEAQTIEVNAPYSITYIYAEYDKLSIISQVKLPSTLADREHQIENLLRYADEYSGEYWVENGKSFKIPFRDYVLADYRFILDNFESNLKINIEHGSITTVVNKPGFIKIYYTVDVKVKVVLSYTGDEKIFREAWVPLGSRYTISLEELLSPRTIGERIELKSLKSDFDYEFIREEEKIGLEVYSPGTVELSIDRYFLVRIRTITSLDVNYPSCIGPPDLTQYSSGGDPLEFWVLEKTPLTCYFPERIDGERESILFSKGFVGDLIYTTPGLKSFYVEEPLSIFMEYRVLKYFEIRGRTHKGVFVGGGLYPEGTRIIWIVEPQKCQGDGLLGLLGFEWRAVNPFGIEEIHEDKIIDVVWVLTPSIESPLLQFMQLTSIAIVSYIASIYYRMWKKGVEPPGGD